MQVADRLMVSISSDCSDCMQVMMKISIVTIHTQQFDVRGVALLSRVHSVNATELNKVHTIDHVIKSHNLYMYTYKARQKSNPLGKARYLWNCVIYYSNFSSNLQC